METNSNHPTDVTFNQNYPPEVRFFIPHSQRQRFFLQFTLMTLLGWVVGGIVSLALENSLNRLNVPFLNSVSSYVASIVFAVIFGADQALVLRRYISGRLWMLATSIGWLMADGVGKAWISYIGNLASYFNASSSVDLMVIVGFLSTLAYIVSGIWLGICQWLVLRRYTISAWWWNFIPAVSFFFISLLICLLSVLQDYLPAANRTAILYWSGQALTAVILGVIPAIGLCTLKKNYPRKRKSLVPLQ